MTAASETAEGSAADLKMKALASPAAETASEVSEAECELSAEQASVSLSESQNLDVFKNTGAETLPETEAAGEDAIMSESSADAPSEMPEEPKSETMPQTAASSDEAIAEYQTESQALTGDGSSEESSPLTPAQTSRAAEETAQPTPEETAQPQAEETTVSAAAETSEKTEVSENKETASSAESETIIEETENQTEVSSTEAAFEEIAEQTSADETSETALTETEAPESSSAAEETALPSAETEPEETAEESVRQTASQSSETEASQHREDNISEEGFESEPQSNETSASGEAETEPEEPEKSDARTDRIDFELSRIRFLDEGTPLIDETIEFEIKNEAGLSEGLAYAGEDKTLTLERSGHFKLQVNRMSAAWLLPEDLSFSFDEEGNMIKAGAETADYYLDIVLDKAPLRMFMMMSRMPRSGSDTPIPNPEVIPENVIAPANYLQILDGIPGADSEIIASGTGVAEQVLIPADGQADGAALWGGNWDEAKNKMFTQFQGGGDVHSVRFNASDTSAADYQIDPDAGWNSADLNMDSTQMWVKVKYKSAALFHGRAVDAVATIKVTPMKNRTPGLGWASNDYGYSSYNPMIQFSDTLYRGWCWQNVKEINVDLQFFEKNSETPITFPSGTFQSEDAIYYTVNSLNPGQTSSDGHWIGPEYVVPQDGTVNGAYIVPGSHIESSYDGGPDGIQYAYNGAMTDWDGDDPSHENWSLNSVMFTTAETNRFNFTMGNLEREPENTNVERTEFVWASISSQSFKNTYVTYKEVPLQKLWSEEDPAVDEVKITIYRSYKVNDEPREEEYRSLKLMRSRNWKGQFNRIPDKASLKKILEKREEYENAVITDVKYVIKEERVPGYQTEIVLLSEAQGFEITNTKVYGQFTVKKLDKNNELLDTAEFTLYDAENKVVKTVGTVNGIASFEKIVPGKYSLKETKSPDGYLLSPGVYTVVIDEQGQASVTPADDALSQNGSFTLSVYNTPNKIEFSKKNHLAEPLPGALFGLYKKVSGVYQPYLRDGSPLQAMSAEVSGKFSFERLEPGEYALKEEHAPAGYAEAQGFIKAFKVKTDGSIVQDDAGESVLDESFLTLSNELVKVELLKFDRQNPEVKLEGAVFSLYKDPALTSESLVTAYTDEAMTAEATEFSTNAEGLVTIYGLACDTDYYLKEVRAPEGYYQNDSVIRFKIDEEIKPQLIDVTTDFVSVNTEGQLAVKNSKLYHLPSSGSAGTYFFTAVGCALITAGLLSLILRRKLRR